MTLTELQKLLDELTWEQMEFEGNDYLAKLMGQCDDQGRALRMLLNWFNAHRPDEGFVTVI